LSNSIRQKKSSEKVSKNVYELRLRNSENTHRLRKVHSAFVSLMSKLGKVHPCTGTEALYTPYGPQEE